MCFKSILPIYYIKITETLIILVKSDIVPGNSLIRYIQSLSNMALSCNVSKKCSPCTIRILLSLGRCHLDFQNRPLSKPISRLQFKLQIHNEIKFTTLVYRCDHKVTHCTDSVIKSSSTLLFPMISLYEAFWRDYEDYDIIIQNTS